jgi:hypothetical protein
MIVMSELVSKIPQSKIVARRGLVGFCRYILTIGIGEIPSSLV